MPSIPYKSFCWSLGTTSFRTKEFNRTIERQLSLLNEFWKDHNRESWTGNNLLQSEYYDFMKAKGFVEGEAGRKAKDAREKTSGLVDVGLIDDGRRLTQAGEKLLEIAYIGDFSSDNGLNIQKDSFVYLKQLLKTTNVVDGNRVRPFLVLLHLLKKFDYLATEEFTYLLPLCVSLKGTENVVRDIKKLRSGKTNIDDIIISHLLSMENYQEAEKLLGANKKVTEQLICDVGMNRKSRDYDKPYFELYKALYKVFIDKKSSSIVELYKATNKIIIGKYWRNYLFDTISERSIEKEPEKHLKTTAFSNVKGLSEFKALFFRTMHLFKAKATLSDYVDLNRRYIKTTDVVLFEDDSVRLDVVPKHFFNGIEDQLYASAFVETSLLPYDCSMEDIADCLRIDERVIINSINSEYDTQITTTSEAKSYLDDTRYKRFGHLIDTRFGKDTLIELLSCFQTRNDNRISVLVTDNADIPTIFEYILGIIWYVISDHKGRILDYMKLSLDSDLLPKTHAAGGEADIVYKYEASGGYKEHALLLEATLADGANQRRMEMEPVSRHLGEYLLNAGGRQIYCVFITTYLHVNVISDFLCRRHDTYTYHDSQSPQRYVTGMNIVPIQTSELRKILEDGLKYIDLYPIFMEALKSKKLAHEWYDDCIATRL